MGPLNLHHCQRLSEVLHHSQTVNLLNIIIKAAVTFCGKRTRFHLLLTVYQNILEVLSHLVFWQVNSTFLRRYQTEEGEKQLRRCSALIVIAAACLRSLPLTSVTPHWIVFRTLHSGLFCLCWVFFFSLFKFRFFQRSRLFPYNYSVGNPFFIILVAYFSI